MRCSNEEKEAEKVNALFPKCEFKNIDKELDQDLAREACMKFLRTYSAKVDDIEPHDWPTIKKEFEIFLLNFPFAQYTVHSANKSKKKGPVEQTTSDEWMLKVVKQEMKNPESMKEEVKHHLAYYCWTMGRDFFEQL